MQLPNNYQCSIHILWIFEYRTFQNVISLPLMWGKLGFCSSSQGIFKCLHEYLSAWTLCLVARFCDGTNFSTPLSLLSLQTFLFWTVDLNIAPPLTGCWNVSGELFAVKWRIYRISPRIPYRNCCIVTLLEQYNHTCALLALYIPV